MASPMRKKRAWSTRENDAESKETAAFEATVAAAKDTAAKSGAFLSTAKSDLTDHQRWLQAQSAAVERDRARHERWLERQREHRLALARKDRARRRRQLMRQRAFRAMQAAAIASLLFVRSLILLAFAKTVAGLKSIGALIARGAASLARLIAAGARWTFAKLRALALWIGRTLSVGLAWSGAKAQVGARAGGSALAAGSSLVAAKAGVLSRSAGQSIGSSFSAASAKGSALAGVTGRSASRGFARVGEKTSALGASSKRQLAGAYRWSMKRAAAVAPALYVRVAKLGRQAERYARARAARAEGMFEQAKVAVTASGSGAPAAVAEIYGPRRDGAEIVGCPANDPWMPPAEPQAETVSLKAQATEVAEVYGPFYEGFWVEGVSPNEPRLPEPAAQPEIAAPRVKGENKLSSWARGAWYRTASLAAQTGAWARSRSWAPTREVDLSQMMIIAGAVLLVCGGLLLGGGLFLRAGAGTAPTEVAEEEAPTGITWTFQETDRPLPERAVFTLSGTPASFLINGLSVSGVNQSDQPLTGVEAVLKPDANRPDLKLTLQVDKPAAPAGEGDTAAQALEVVPKDTVPPKAPFRLVFPFPPEAMDGTDGITVQEFFESYGGLLLKVRYELDGKQRSLIQYLSPDMLKAQLDEVSAEAGG